jgi:hypothetical protein
VNKFIDIRKNFDISAFSIENKDSSNFSSGKIDSPLKYVSHPRTVNQILNKKWP